MIFSERAFAGLVVKSGGQICDCSRGHFHECRSWGNSCGDSKLPNHVVIDIGVALKIELERRTVAVLQQGCNLFVRMAEVFSR